MTGEAMVALALAGAGLAVALIALLAAGAAHQRLTELDAQTRRAREVAMRYFPEALQRRKDWCD